MVVASSLIAIKIPRVSGRITVADTFIFLGMLMFGGAAAIWLSTLEGIAVTLMGISKKPRFILLNSAILATSTFFTATVLNRIFGPPADLAKDFRSEERRVGKEGRCEWCVWTYNEEGGAKVKGVEAEEG